MKRVIAVTVAVIMIIGSASLAFASTEDWNSANYTSADTAINDTAKYILEHVPNPEIGSVGGEWSIVGLTASGYAVPKEYYEAYYKRVESKLKENQGVLTSNKYTEYSRLIIALTAIGKDVTNVAGYNLLEKLSDFENIKKQGINGPAYALIALDCHDYQIPKVAGVATETTRQLLVDYILAQEITDGRGVKGGFSLAGGTVPDADITGMALQALSNYQNQPKVKLAIDRSIQVLKTLEKTDGTYTSWGTETCETVVQVIVAKTALDVDAGRNVAGLLKYYKTGNGFEHVLGDGQNLLATEQSLYALASYKLKIAENRGLYDLNPVTITGNQIKVVLDGKLLEFEQPPVIIGGRTLVPMRGIFEELGASISWNEALKEVTGDLNGKVIKLKIGSKTAYINGVAMALDVPAQIINSRTVVPIRFVAESLGIRVMWDDGKRTVSIER